MTQRECPRRPGAPDACGRYQAVGAAPVVSASGSSLVELLVTLTVTGLVLAGALSIMRSFQITDADSSVRASTQQTGRVALDWIERDLMRAGIGYTDLVAPYPTIVPLDDGGIEIRSNPSGVTRYLKHDLDRGLNRIEINEPAGLAAGDRILVYDSTGKFQELTIAQVADRGMELVLTTAAGGTYMTKDGAAVAPLETIRYWIEPAADADSFTSLMRRVGEGPAHPLAENVLALDLTYIDDSDPPRVFAPVSNAQMLRIRAVEASLRIEATERRLDNGEVPSVSFTTRVVPRAVSLTAAR